MRALHGVRPHASRARIPRPLEDVRPVPPSHLSSPLGSSGLLAPHRLMVGDSARVHAFQKALHEVVRPGDVVADIGTGTGLLACFACQAGASRVYAIEWSEMIEAAR